ncbi:unnamed protein product [Adineta steineri]|uniref:Apple domain-containing protein n=1 Tax=Adineta steineri TaxID=433720 RepID=A0A813XQ33_9BILA|nr:unnamed protein product [Adineta steineri]
MFSRYLCVLIFAWCILGPMHLESISIGWESLVTFSSYGFEFSPIDEQALFILESNVNSIMSCVQTCHSNTQCRIFDFDDQLHRCRIFEGDITTMGSVVTSSLSVRSIVGTIELQPDNFVNRGQPCSYCQESRYLTCINVTCQCQSHTFFDGSICQSQKLLGAECIDSTECRYDLNYTCLPRQQCGREYYYLLLFFIHLINTILSFIFLQTTDMINSILTSLFYFAALSIQNGNTVGGYANGTAGNALNALNFPGGLSLDYNGFIYVSDFNNNRVIKLQEGSLVGSIIAGTGVSGSSASQLSSPAGLYVDASLNIYVVDTFNFRVMLWHMNSSSGIRIAGSGSYGTSSSTLSYAGGIVVDSLGNQYICDAYNHRVMKWLANATSGILIAGTGVAGSSSQQLNMPYTLYLDESNAYLYIADGLNHRIQRYDLRYSMNVTTVAGGNGPGTGSHQLNTPIGVYLSKKTGAIYIADSNNHRIQRWIPGATHGVTIGGLAGLSGNNATLLNQPRYVSLNLNETQLYVTDGSNNRVQRFQLI